MESFTVFMTTVSFRTTDHQHQHPRWCLELGIRLKLLWGKYRNHSKISTVPLVKSKDKLDDKHLNIDTSLNICKIFKYNIIILSCYIRSVLNCSKISFVYILYCSDHRPQFYLVTEARREPAWILPEPGETGEWRHSVSVGPAAANISYFHIK